MSRSSWAVALAFVWHPENDGQGFHADADDTGGATNKGVTLATWNVAVAHGYVTGRLNAASDTALASILHTACWWACGCDDLPPGVDLAVFNLAMTAGAGRAAYILQAVVGTKQDGVIGPITLGAAMNMDAGALIAAFTDKEESFYAKCPTAWKFLHGWDRRAEDCRIAAQALVSQGAAQPD